jgi:hypothetical protein
MVLVVLELQVRLVVHTFNMRLVAGVAMPTLL